MKFIFADSQDFVDPNYDFQKDKCDPERIIQRTDKYPHEMFKQKPYDGMLVSRAILADGVYSTQGAYTDGQAQRFKREGARSFLRYDDGPIFGDCGAFSYAKLDNPPYQTDEMIEYYKQCNFTHCVSIDHIIFEYSAEYDNPNSDEKFTVNDTMKKRYQITLDNANEFLEKSKKNNVKYEPIGVVQAWSPKSMQHAAKSLVSMGYDYIAIGGLVPLSVEDCEEIVSAIRSEIGNNIGIHLFGFAKARHLDKFVKYNIASFDSTSPLIKAFKDQKKNFFSPEYDYMAIRIPSTDDNSVLRNKITSGQIEQSLAKQLEKEALSAIRGYAKSNISLDETLKKIENYEKLFRDKVPLKDYKYTLESRFWEKCSCEICQEIGVEVVIFRNSNRNRRRGFHNLWQFQRELEKITQKESKQKL